MFKLNLNVFSGLCFLILYGCSTTTNNISQSRVDSWQFSGKIAVTYPRERCNKIPCPKSSSQGKIDWRQKNNRYLISLYDPFGRKLVDLKGNKEQVELTSPNQASIYAGPEDFLSLLGGSKSIKQVFKGLTPEDFKYWAIGRPNPNLVVKQENNDKTEFMQKNFLIKSKQWRSTVLGQMPSLVTIIKEPYRIRLVIKEWLLP